VPTFHPAANRISSTSALHRCSTGSPRKVSSKIQNSWIHLYPSESFRIRSINLQ
jgi:hypothetical protein